MNVMYGAPIPHSMNEWDFYRQHEAQAQLSYHQFFLYCKQSEKQFKQTRKRKDKHRSTKFKALASL